jgi:hypothetical protein
VKKNKNIFKKNHVVYLKFNNNDTIARYFFPAMTKKEILQYILSYKLYGEALEFIKFLECDNPKLQNNVIYLGD